MEDKTGIFGFTEVIDKTQHAGQIEAMLDWARSQIWFKWRGAVVERIVPGVSLLVGLTEMQEQHGPDTIKLKQKLLVALSDWTVARVGDCVVGDEAFKQAQEINGEIWLFEYYGVFPMVGPYAASTTRMVVYKRVN